MTDQLLLAAAAVVGALLGLAADRLATRWPEHLPEYTPRAIDWRTLVLIASGALVAAGLAARGGEPRDVLVLAVFALVLLMLMATDLDQHLLPDELTLPLIVFAAVVLVINWSPALAGKELGLASGIGTGIGAPILLLVSDRILGGQLGLGDVKLSVSLGLMFGASLLFYSLVLASLGFALVLVVLIVFRRISLQSVIPFGPVLIYAAFVAAVTG